MCFGTGSRLSNLSRFNDGPDGAQRPSPINPQIEIKVFVRSSPQVLNELRKTYNSVCRSALIEWENS
jgi:hypothetical protein